MRVCVLGSNGQLGGDICAAFREDGDDVTELTHDQVEVSSPQSVRTALEAARPEVVINTTALHVEKSEEDAAAAFLVNAVGAGNVARVCAALSAAVVHISTDYVFDGSQQHPYREDDSPRPLNVYGASKLAGEHLVRISNPQHFVVRVAGIYGHRPCRGKAGLNFVETMLKRARDVGTVRVVDDEFTTPTPTVQIAQQLILLARTHRYGMYHATAEGGCSWFEFARAIFEVAGVPVCLERARPGEFAAKVARPKNSVLENAALKAAGVNVFTNWHEGLERYLAGRASAASAENPVVAVASGDIPKRAAGD